MINISNMIEERSIQYADKSKRKLYKLVLYFFILTSFSVASLRIVIGR